MFYSSPCSSPPPNQEVGISQNHHFQPPVFIKLEILKLGAPLGYLKIYGGFEFSGFAANTLKVLPPHASPEVGVARAFI